MKVVAFNGSPKKEGNTYYALKLVADELEKEGIDVEIVHIGKDAIRGCTSCFYCAKTREGQCVFKDDCVNECIEKMKEADGVILGAPTYYANIPGTMKSFLDRAFFTMGNSKTDYLRHKVGASVTAVRRSGEVGALDAMDRYLAYSEMTLATSNYWNMIHGMTPGEAAQDEEGIQIMRVLGRNMAHLLKMREATSDLPAPERERKVFTNFIR